MQVRGPIPGMGKQVTSSLRHRVQTGTGTTQSPIQWVPGVKRPGRETDHSPPSSTEIKNAWSYSQVAQYVFMAWCLIK
jgi:hypothetical protein